VLFPETIGGWLTATGALLTITVILMGFLIKLANMQIDSRIRIILATTVSEAIEAAVAPIGLQLDAMQTQMAANGKELGRVRVIEAKIENGLAHRQERIETKMDSLLEHYAWNGDERRNDEGDHG
jgi:hypothetical protein